MNTKIQLLEQQIHQALKIATVKSKSDQVSTLINKQEQEYLNGMEIQE